MNETLDHSNADAILRLISAEKLTSGQIAKRLKIFKRTVEMTLLWIEKNICLLTEDPDGKLQIYKEER